MVKFHVEVTYSVLSEPSEFNSISKLNERRVYLWGDKRGLLSSDIPWTVEERASQYSEEPKEGFVEFWRPARDENPPTDPDDVWREEYKRLEKERITLEWHPSHRSLRVAWHQTEETLQRDTVLVAAQQEIQRLGLPPLKLPQVLAQLPLRELLKMEQDL